jgi:hypothetical protein
MQVVLSWPLSLMIYQAIFQISLLTILRQFLMSLKLLKNPSFEF